MFEEQNLGLLPSHSMNAPKRGIDHCISIFTLFLFSNPEKSGDLIAHVCFLLSYKLCLNVTWEHIAAVQNCLENVRWYGPLYQRGVKTSICGGCKYLVLYVNNARALGVNIGMFTNGKMSNNLLTFNTYVRFNMRGMKTCFALLS